MKKIVVVNASPRPKWNTGQLCHAVADGAKSAGAEVAFFDISKLEPYTGCRSCFICKMEKTRGVCPVKDGLAPVLQAIREADALVLGTPNYFGRPTAGFRALFERLCFQYLTYRSDIPSRNEHRIPVLLIMTSNAAPEYYPQLGYDKMIEEHARVLEAQIGPVTAYVCGDTLQTDHYEKFDWNYFDIEAKQRRHEEVFPAELEKMREMGAELAR